MSGNFQIKQKSVVLIIFILLGLGIYYNTLNNSFHYDDQHHIVRNPYIQSTGNIPFFFTEHRMFSALSGVFLHYRPLVMVSYALNYYFGNLDPAGYHLINLGLHVGSAFMLFLIVEAVSLSFAAAFAAGLIFLTTPFNSEVVNYVTARSSVMTSFFMLLSFYCWMQYRKTEVNSKQSAVNSKQSTGNRFKGFSAHCSPLTAYYYVASFLAFLLGMLTKEVAIMIPVMFLLYDIYFSRIFVRVNYRLLLPYIPFGITGVFIGFVIRLLFFKSSSLYSALSMAKKSADADFISNIIIGVKVLAKYSYSIFVPAGLSVWHKIEGTPDIFFIFAFLLIAVLMASAFILWRRSDRLSKVSSFFIMWFFVMLLPMTVVSLTAPYQENRGHIAAAGLTAALVAGIAALIARSDNARYLKGATYSIAAVMIVLYSSGTVVRNGVWLNDLTLWTDVSRKYPDAHDAKIAIGLAHQTKGDLVSAESEYQKILKLDPQNNDAYLNLGTIYYMRHELDKSLEHFLVSKETNPFDPTVNIYLSKIYREKGDMRSAAKHLLMLIAISPHNIASYQELAEVYITMGETDKLQGMMKQAIGEDPNNAGAYRALGIISLSSGELASAQKAFEKVLAYVPTNQDVLLDLGYLYGRRGIYDRAEEMFKRVIALSPNDAEAMQALGSTYQRQGKLNEALEAYQNVLRHNPEYFTSYNNLGLLFLSGRNTASAIGAFEKALGQNPNDPMARFNLARAYEVQGRHDLARKEYQKVVKETSGDQRNVKLYESARKKLAEL